jgi:hypothetical protein
MTVVGLPGALAFALALAAASAPIQCGHAPDPNERREDTPGDALWQLAQKFHQEHDDKAERRTLQYLVEQYPSSRWAPAAREQLGQGGERSDGTDGGS